MDALARPEVGSQPIASFRRKRLFIHLNLAFDQINNPVQYNTGHSVETLFGRAIVFQTGVGNFDQQSDSIRAGMALEVILGSPLHDSQIRLRFLNSREGYRELHVKVPAERLNGTEQPIGAFQGQSVARSVSHGSSSPVASILADQNAIDELGRLAFLQNSRLDHPVILIYGEWEHRRSTACDNLFEEYGTHLLPF